MPAKSNSPVPAAEWVVAAIGLVVFASVVGLMLYDAFAGDHSAPQITVKVESISRNGEGYLVKFRAENLGGETAADVVVDGELPAPDGVGGVETASTTLDFLPGHSERQGGFFFKSKPEPDKIRLRASSYREP